MVVDIDEHPTDNGVHTHDHLGVHSRDHPDNGTIEVIGRDLDHQTIKTIIPVRLDTINRGECSYVLIIIIIIKCIYILPTPYFKASILN